MVLVVNDSFEEFGLDPNEGTDVMEILQHGLVMVRKVSRGGFARVCAAGIGHLSLPGRGVSGGDQRGGKRYSATVLRRRFCRRDLATVRRVSGEGFARVCAAGTGHLSLPGRGVSGGDQRDCKRDSAMVLRSSTGGFAKIGAVGTGHLSRLGIGFSGGDKSIGVRDLTMILGIDTGSFARVDAVRTRLLSLPDPGEAGGDKRRFGRDATAGPRIVDGIFWLDAERGRGGDQRVQWVNLCFYRDCKSGVNSFDLLWSLLNCIPWLQTGSLAAILIERTGSNKIVVHGALLRYARCP